MKKAVSYQRVAVRSISCPEDSIDYQKQDIQKYCQQNEIDLLHSFEDVGSGSIMDRSGWNELQAFVQQHHSSIDFLIVKKLDRISRKFQITQSIIQELKDKYGIEVLTTSPVSKDEAKLFEDLRLLIK